MKLMLINIDQKLNRLLKSQLLLLDPLNQLEKTYIDTSENDDKLFEDHKNSLFIVKLTQQCDMHTIANCLFGISQNNNQVIIVGTDSSYDFIRQVFRLGAYDYWVDPFQKNLIHESLLQLLDIGRYSHQKTQLKARIIEAIHGDVKIERYDLERYYQLSLPLIESKAPPIQIMGDFILELIMPLSFEPMELPKPKVARLCAGWILEQDAKVDAICDVINYIGIFYREIFYPNVSSEIVRNAIYEVLAPSQQHKTVKYIADKLYINQSHLSLTFKRYTGITLSEYIKRIKLYGAMWMLLDRDYNFDDILDILGYKDEQYFSSIFKKMTGYLPGTYSKTFYTTHLKK